MNAVAHCEAGFLASICVPRRTAIHAGALDAGGGASSLELGLAHAGVPDLRAHDAVCHHVNGVILGQQVEGLPRRSPQTCRSLTQVMRGGTARLIVS